MTHLAERVDQVFQLIVTLDTIFLAVVPTTSDRMHFIVAFLAGAIATWSIGYIRKIDTAKLLGWTFLANATGIYWLFFYWAEFQKIIAERGLSSTPEFQLIVGAIWFTFVSLIWLWLRTSLYRPVSKWTFLIIHLIFLVIPPLTFYSSFSLVHP